MIVTYEKQYTEQKFDNFTLYSNLSFSSTKVFWEYNYLIKSFSNESREEITDKIINYKKTSKSNLRVGFTIYNQIEFFKPDKYIFPEMYIIFN